MNLRKFVCNYFYILFDSKILYCNMHRNRVDQRLKYKQCGCNDLIMA